MEKMIELSPAENTAYFWVNRIRNLTREIAECKELSNTRPITREEVDFYQLFSNFSEKKWRELYLKLVEKIDEDINNYVPPKSKLWKFTEFSQDTLQGGHDRINEEVGQIINKTIPDVDLSGEFHDGAVIYTAKNGIQIFDRYNSFINMFPTNKAEYILTGDEEELYLYELLVLTIYEIAETNKGFDSLEILRNGFIKKFKNSHKQFNDIEFQEMFNKCFDLMAERGLIYGNSKISNYWPKLLKYDIDNNSLSVTIRGKNLLNIEQIGGVKEIAESILNDVEFSGGPQQ